MDGERHDDPPEAMLFVKNIESKHVCEQSTIRAASKLELSLLGQGAAVMMRT